jgi:hypothetical protein
LSTSCGTWRYGAIQGMYLEVAWGHTLAEVSPVRALQSFRTFGTALSLSLALLTSSCSDSTGPAVSRNQGGIGSGTLKITGTIDGSDVAGGFTTQFLVSLRNAAGTPVSGATVTVRNASLGTVNLLELSAASGDYEASVNSFASGDYRLDVTKGTDNVQGVVVGGMAAHHILAPAANATVAAGQPLTVTWTRPSEAVGANLETRDFIAGGIPDLATFTIPAANNPARPDQRIRLCRFNQVDITGGLAGSRLELSVRNTSEPIVVQ